MIEMLHNEARKLLIEGYEATHNTEAIAKIFHVNKYTVYHLEERKRKTGSVDLQTWRRGRKALLNSKDKARIAKCITKNPFASRPPHLCGVTLKLAIEHWRLVFLGKSSENIGMTRRYGRAIGKARVHGSAPLNVPTSQTVLASVRLNGQITYTMYPGETSDERFLDYLKNVLIPTLHKGGIVVMDNMRSHHVKGVEEVLRAAGIIPLYLPPYSPDLNPIEMLWSKMKAILRKLGCNIAVLLPQMVAHALALVSPEDCFGWFTADGY